MALLSACNDVRIRVHTRCSKTRIRERWSTRVSMVSNAFTQRRRRKGLDTEPKAIDMNSFKAIALVLIAAGILSLTYGGFSYTKDTTVVKLGPFELSAKEKETVNVPMWVGIGAIVVGGLLLVMGGKK